MTIRNSNYFLNSLVSVKEDIARHKKEQERLKSLIETEPENKRVRYERQLEKLNKSLARVKSKLNTQYKKDGTGIAQGFFRPDVAAVCYMYFDKYINEHRQDLDVLLWEEKRLERLFLLTNSHKSRKLFDGMIQLVFDLRVKEQERREAKRGEDEL